jgi:hypothetical protein
MSQPLPARSTCTAAPCNANCKSRHPASEREHCLLKNAIFPHSAFRIPHSAFRIPHSAFRDPRS